MARELLGRTRQWGGRVRVYDTGPALEIDESEDYRIRRRRLFYDEILLVTHHRRTDWPGIVVSLVLAGLFGLLAAAVARNETTAALVLFAITGVPFILWGASRIAFKIDFVTVFGKRTQARMRFFMRKRRAREVFDRVCRKAREQQEGLPLPAQAPQRAAL
jgi:hypothetical protein